MKAVTRLWIQTLRSASMRTQARTMRLTATNVAMVLTRSMPTSMMACGRLVTSRRAAERAALAERSRSAEEARPAAWYPAEALIKQPAALAPPVAIRVDVIDRLPTPYGLVRYGVAPDHKSIKSIAEYLRGVLEHDGVSFVGGVRLGTDVTRDELLACYDAVVYATGAMRDRQLGIPRSE